MNLPTTSLSANLATKIDHCLERISDLQQQLEHVESELFAYFNKLRSLDNKTQKTIQNNGKLTDLPL